MAEPLSEAEMKEKAIRYLKTQYGEDTVRMDIRNNGVEDGSGVLHVDCTVSVGGSQSDWTKWFTFRQGEVESMRWQMR
ncbi:MAG: hypothetical protein J4F39_17895 [Candidatus Latescibacteria bacterium]|nr:hypothetical protein [Candidatus Latescibacterota bacterium]